jgi:hypothetical protein
MCQLDENWVTIELFSGYLSIGHGTKSKEKLTTMVKTQKRLNPRNHQPSAGQGSS